MIYALAATAAAKQPPDFLDRHGWAIFYAIVGLLIVWSICKD